MLRVAEDKSRRARRAMETEGYAGTRYTDKCHFYETFESRGMHQVRHELCAKLDGLEDRTEYDFCCA